MVRDVIRRLVATVSAALLLGAMGGGAAEAAPRKYHLECKKVVKGEQQSSVTVYVLFTLQGSLLRRYAVWDPPMHRDKKGNLSVSVVYDSPSGQGLGAPERLTSFAAMEIGSLTGSDIVLEALGERHDYRVEASIDVPGYAGLYVQRPPVSMAHVVLAGEDGSTVVKPDLLARLDTLGQTRVAMSRRDYPTEEVRVDLSAITARDAMFQKAWAAASSRKPAECIRMRDWS